jgi:hypothetical protein
MKGEWKIPFKKLEWYSGVTEEGEKQGYIHQIGEFFESKTRHPFRNYLITNHKETSLSNILTVYSSDEDKQLGEVQTLLEAKEMCQKDLEFYIIKTFFEDDGRAV